MLVLGDKHEQVLVLLVEQFHAAHDIEQRRIAGVPLELGMFHVVRGTDACHIAIGTILVYGGIEPGRKGREEPALNILYGGIALTKNILTFAIDQCPESFCAIFVEKNLGQHKYGIPIEEAVTDTIYFGALAGRFGIEAAFALKIAIALVADNLLEVTGIVGELFEQENHEATKKILAVHVFNIQFFHHFVHNPLGISTEKRLECHFFNLIVTISIGEMEYGLPFSFIFVNGIPEIEKDF